MKIIFLDIDGVLNWRGSDRKHDVDGFIGLDPEHVARFNRLIDAHPDAKIVISSSWRHCSPLHVQAAYHDFEGLKKLLADRGVKGDIIGHTPIFFGNRGRGHEIREGLAELRKTYPDLTYLILDDDRTGMAPYVPHRTKWDSDEDWAETMANVEEDLRPFWVKTSFDGYPVRTMYGGGYECEEGGLRDYHIDEAIKILSGTPNDVRPAEPPEKDPTWE